MVFAPARNKIARAAQPNP